MKPNMNEISLLQKTLKNHFSWHGARIKFLALFIMAKGRQRAEDAYAEGNIGSKGEGFFITDYPDMI